MTEEQEYKKSEEAYDEVMLLWNLDFMHFRLDRKELDICEVIKLYKHERETIIKR